MLLALNFLLFRIENKDAKSMLNPPFIYKTL